MNVPKWKLPVFKMPDRSKVPGLAKLSVAMDPVVGFLNKRSTKEKQLILGLVIVLVAVADLMILVGPVARNLMENAPKLPPLRRELKQLRQDLKDKAGIAKRWEEARQAVLSAEKRFVDAGDSPALLENLSQQAQRAGVKITSVEPQEKERGEKGLYAPLPIELKATAGMHELGNFLSELETGDAFFLVKGLRVSANAQNERKHLVQLSLETYKKQK